jgi:copper chaperone CopZ
MRRSNSKTLSSISTDDLESLAVLSPNVNKLVQKSEIPPENVETKLLVKGVCCASEIPLVKKILGIVEGVGEVDVNVPLRQVNVTHDIRVAPVATLVG